MSDMFDIVNLNDQVVGKIAEGAAPDSTRIVRVVHNWIIGSDGRILFQFRAAHKKHHPRRFDASCGGRVNAGETYDMAVVRETREELGIETNPTFLAKIFRDVPGEYKFVSVYASRHDGPFSGWEVEAECLEWMTLHEAVTLFKRHPYLLCIGQSLELVRTYLEGQS